VAQAGDGFEYELPLWRQAISLRTKFIVQGGARLGWAGEIAAAARHEDRV